MQLSRSNISEVYVPEQLNQLVSEVANVVVLSIFS
jgi:hypothetical protein